MRDGIPVRLPPQPAQVLLLLVERAGEVVTREEIQKLAWADNTIVDFEVGINRCIRRIRAALIDDADAPRYLETIPRVGYRFIAPVAGRLPPEAIVSTPLYSSNPSLVVEPSSSSKHSRFGQKLVLLGSLGIVLLITLAFSLWFRWRPGHLSDDLRVTPLANSLGDQFTPTFSPDGRQVAFTWNGKDQDNYDIYVKPVNSSAHALRLTASKDVDFSPAWSPNGEWIAFCRGNDLRGGAIWIMSPFGGAERKVVNLNALGSPWSRALAWSSDSRELVVSVELAGHFERGLHLLDIETGSVRRLTTPASSEEDMYPAVSPDGKSVAFTRDTGRGISSIFLVPFAGGTPRSLPVPRAKHIYNARPTWTPDGSHVAFISNAGGDYHLWLSPVTSPGSAQVIFAVGSNLQDAVFSTSGQLGLVRQTEDSNLWSIDLRHLIPNGPLPATRLFGSTRAEETPTVRSDGLQIAFASNRSGYGEIWTGRVDGSDATQLTFLENPVTGSPDWSPDGRQLIFDSRERGRPNLYVMSADGGQPNMLVTGNGMSVVPHWSRDGKYVYFSSDRTGRMEIWRVRSNGGNPEQMTREGGFAAVPSSDGRTLYFTSDNAPISSLWKMQVASGARTLVSNSVVRRAYTPTAEGIYFFTAATSKDESSLFFLSGQSNEKVLMFRTNQRVWQGMTLAPDGHTLYYSRLDVSGEELLLVPNFWR